MQTPRSLNSHIATRVADGKKSLLIYYPAGFPDMDTSLQAFTGFAQAGADTLEIGFPYSDPMMDGGIIQEASYQAISQGYTPKDNFAMASNLTAAISIPVVLMTYYNIAWHYQRPNNLGGFAQAARQAGIGGAILPDLPASEGAEWNAHAQDHDIQTVYLVSPSSDETRIAQVAKATTGFVYATSHMGVTGLQDQLSRDAAPLVARIRSVTDVPVCMGIGISTPEQAAQVAEFADGIIVGSAVVRAVKEHGVQAGIDLVGQLKNAIS